MARARREKIEEEEDEFEAEIEGVEDASAAERVRKTVELGKGEPLCGSGVDFAKTRGGSGGPSNWGGVKPLRGSDLEKFVAKPNWREMLEGLVVAEKLDPWDIDITKVANAYIAKIREMELLDLRVPANLVLAASIILRLKSDSVRFEEEEQVVEEEVFISEERPPVEIPMLSLRARIPPKRKISLAELVAAVDKVFKEIKERAEAGRKEEKPLVISLPKYDISERMEEVYARVKKLADAQGLLTFSALLAKKTKMEKIFTLLPLLHLTQKERINIWQEEFFGEIFIQIVA